MSSIELFLDKSNGNPFFKKRILLPPVIYTAMCNKIVLSFITVSNKFFWVGRMRTKNQWAIACDRVVQIVLCCFQLPRVGWWVMGFICTCQYIGIRTFAVTFQKSYPGSCLHPRLPASKCHTWDFFLRIYIYKPSVIRHRPLATSRRKFLRYFRPRLINDCGSCWPTTSIL